MSSAKVLERLLRLRELEEEQQRFALETVVVERNRSAARLALSLSVQAETRQSYTERIEADDPPGRLDATLRLANSLKESAYCQWQWEATDRAVAAAQEQYFAQRLLRRQAETLVEEQRRKANVEATRRAQQMLDDWYGRKSSVKGRRNRDGD